MQGGRTACVWLHRLLSDLEGARPSSLSINCEEANGLASVVCQPGCEDRQTVFFFWPYSISDGSTPTSQIRLNQRWRGTLDLQRRLCGRQPLLAAWA
jgi:hypothetical protein